MHAFSEYLAAVASAESLDALDAIAEDSVQPVPCVLVVSSCTIS